MVYFLIIIRPPPNPIQIIQSPTLGLWRVWGLGVEGSEFSVWGLRSGVWGSGCRV